MASKEQIDGLKAKAQELLDAVSAIPVDAETTPAPSAGDDLASKLKDLQAKVDALAKERDAYKDAIQAEIDDQKADSARLEKAIKPVEQVEVPVVTDVVPVPEAQAPAQDAAPAIDGSVAKPLNA